MDKSRPTPDKEEIHQRALRAAARGSVGDLRRLLRRVDAAAVVDAAPPRSPEGCLLSLAARSGSKACLAEVWGRLPQATRAGRFLDALMMFSHLAPPEDSKAFAASPEALLVPRAAFLDQARDALVGNGDPRQPNINANLALAMLPLVGVNEPIDPRDGATALMALTGSDSAQGPIAAWIREALPLADLSQRDANGRTLLLRACASGDIRMAASLIALGSDALDRDNAGDSCLALAMASRASDMAAMVDAAAEAQILRGGLGRPDGRPTPARMAL